MTSLFYIHMVTPYGRRAILTVIVCFFRFIPTARFSWTPTQPGEFGVAFFTTDDGSPLGYYEEAITIFVTTGDLSDEPLSPGDFDIDCAVDIDGLNITLGDYRIWRGHFNIAQYFVYSCVLNV